MPRRTDRLHDGKIIKIVDTPDPPNNLEREIERFLRTSNNDLIKEVVKEWADQNIITPDYDSRTIEKTYYAGGETNIIKITTRKGSDSESFEIKHFLDSKPPIKGKTSRNQIMLTRLGISS